MGFLMSSTNPVERRKYTYIIYTAYMIKYLNAWYNILMKGYSKLENLPEQYW